MAHVENVRAFAWDIRNIETGILNRDWRARNFANPRTFIQFETEWIRNLLEAILIINQNITMVDRWASHVYGITSNIGITREELIQIERAKVSVKTILQSKVLDEDYLRWVIKDISQEADRLIAETRHQMDKAARLVELAERIGGQFMENVKKITLAWITGNRRDFPETLIAMLQKAHCAENGKEVLYHLGAYLDTIAWLVKSTPMFPDGPPTAGYTLDRLRDTKKLATRLHEGAKRLEKLITLRVESYSFFLTHLEALLHAVLPHGISVTQWINTYARAWDKTADDLLPKTLRTDTLPLAIRQAEEALAEWAQAIDAGESLLMEVLALNDLLKSPSLTKLLAADQLRLEAARRWRPKILDSFQTLRRSIRE